MDDRHSAIFETEQHIIVVLTTSNRYRRYPVEWMRGIQFALKFDKHGVPLVLALDRIPRYKPLANHV